jgi:hypothetical protein
MGAQVSISQFDQVFKAGDFHDFPHQAEPTRAAIMRNLEG